VELVAKNNNYDIVLMDCEMPIMDGYTATQKIRAEWGSELPIIAMTANVMADDIERAKKSGMNDHIAKPINFEAMMATIAKWALNTHNVSSNIEKITESIKANPVTKQDSNIMTNAHIDVQAGLKMLTGNKDLYMRLLKRFKENFSDSIVQLTSFLEANNLEEATCLAHTIKGTSANIGTITLQTFAAKIEKYCHDEDIKQAQDVLPDIQLSLNHVLIEIDNFLNSENTTEDEPVIQQSKAVSPEEFNTLVQILRENLENYDSNSEAAFLDLSKAVFIEKDKLALDKLASSIEDYDFEQALIGLNICYPEQG
jgi:CheY-like chemotaxis protein